MALSVLFAGGFVWRLWAAQESERSAGGLWVSAAATAGASTPVSHEAPGVPEIEPSVEAGGQGTMAVQHAPVQQSSAAVAAVGDEEGETEASAPSEPASGESYTWHDGDRALVVRLQPDLVLLDGDVVARDDLDRVGGDADSAAAQSEAGDAGPGRVLAVFRSDEGALMALPGGVVLVLDPDWDGAAVASFFERNGVAAGRTTALDYVANGFFVETRPGLASLDLANTLAAQPGVELSSPNWWQQTATD
ncbi:hypothetical protein [Candidatus Poriferisodalis sp.]|uniref:hypothetical protein n=1 Tax=Candidatus Poriferisodalis sp. TaxID=3101277 RepID=UPI003B01B484